MAILFKRAKAQKRVGTTCRVCGTVNTGREPFCRSCGSLLEDDGVIDQIIATYLYRIVTSIDKAGRVLNAAIGHGLDGLKADFYVEFEDHEDLVFIMRSYDEFVRFKPVGPNGKRVRNVVILAFEGRVILTPSNVNDNVEIYRLAVVDGQFKLIPLTNNKKGKRN